MAQTEKTAMGAPVHPEGETGAVGPGGLPAQGLSARRIVGFACNQGFLFFLLYHGAAGVQDALLPLPRFDLIAVLAAMVVGFCLIRMLGLQRLNRLFARPLLYMYAVGAAAGSLLSVAMPQGGMVVFAAQGALVGIPCALLLTAWGRTFGAAPTDDSVPEVFLGSLVGALLCLVFSFSDASDLVLFATRILPLASVVNIAVPRKAALLWVEAPSETQVEGPMRRLSFRVLLGTFLFGLACGLLGLYQTVGGEGPSYGMALVLFGAFALGSLSLLLSGGSVRGTALNKAYRLAVFMMLVGVLLVPLPQLAGTILPGRSVVLAGYLGLETVFIALFVVMARIRSIDCALEFSLGFSALFAGELLGVVVADGWSGVQPMVADSGVLVAAAGVIALLGYIFFFTERDFDTLTQIASGLDTLEQTCERMVARYGLTARESEILAVALRGRTNERIAQELVIAKSTVDTHLRRIYGKCGVHSRQELLDLAERQ